jgi:dienelactone hydrolase
VTRFLKVFAVTLSAAILAPCAARSQDRQEVLRDFVRLAQEVQELFPQKKYEDVILKCREMSKLLPDEPVPYYNLACAQARLARPDEAFESLNLAVDKGFRDPAHLREDEDLAALRADKRFEEVCRKARENEIKGGGAAYDKGDEIPGVKTVEDFPEGGLKFRLRMSPDASKEKPSRLIVWLHPSGGSMNGPIEQLAPRFAAKGFAMLVPTQKTWLGWTAEDLTRLVDKTLPAVGKIEGIDARKPVLMGYSAGGQAAIDLWLKGPGRFGGLIIDAAYPIVLAAPGRLDVVKIPPDEAAKQVPWLVLVGEKDGGARVWRQVEPAWRKAGVPVRVDYVPGKGHGWLFGGFQLASLDAWLSDVAAGKMPALPEIKPPPEESPLKRPEPPEDPNEKPEPPEFK